MRSLSEQRQAAFVCAELVVAVGRSAWQGRCDGATPKIQRQGGYPTVTGTTLDDYTDRYAQRMRGMTASEIRALFAVTARPEVVSLAGGAPFVAASAARQYAS